MRIVADCCVVDVVGMLLVCIIMMSLLSLFYILLHIIACVLYVGVVSVLVVIIPIHEHTGIDSTTPTATT